MRTRKIDVTPDAYEDLSRIYDRIAENASSRVAWNYVQRIRQQFEKLQVFPQRGTSLEDVEQGLRSLGWGGRVQIVFRVLEDKVQIARVYYGGEDWQSDYPDPSGRDD